MNNISRLQHRLNPLFILLLLLFTVSYHSSLATENASQIGLLWQINKAGLKPSYVFGTIHSEDPRVTQLPSQVQRRFEQADSVTIEMNFSFSNLMKSIFGIYLKPGQTLDKFISKPDYEELVKRLEQHGVPEEVTKRLKPLATLMILSMPKSNSGQFLDLLLYQRAQDLDKPVYGLETVEEQLAIFDALPIPEQVVLLKGSLEYLDDMPKMLEELHELYLQRDLTALLQLNDEYTAKGTAEEKKLTEKFMQRLVDDRNVRMVERMQVRLQEGNAFIAVGALHLPGGKGILKLLEARGYRVLALY